PTRPSGSVEGDSVIVGQLSVASPSITATPSAGTAPMVVKLPTANTWLSTAKARATLLALGFQGVASPVAGSSAATRLRSWPPTALSTRPTYSSPPASASENTGPLALGFSAPASPVAASRAAMRLRAWPPMVVKNPPAYTVPQPTTIERMVPL